MNGGIGSEMSYWMTAERIAALGYFVVPTKRVIGGRSIQRSGSRSKMIGWSSRNIAQETENVEREREREREGKLRGRYSSLPADFILFYFIY